MITAKPRTSTLFSFTLFLLITAIVLVMNLYIVMKDPAPPWYTYIIIGLLLPIFIFVLYKIFIRYKVVKFGNNQIEVQYPVLRKRKAYNLAEVHFWIENKVKTGKTSVYKELGLQFSDKTKITLGQREYSDYDKVLKYLGQKIGKKKKALQG